MREGKSVKIRLWGIDCPERGQAFGKQAKLFMSELVFGKEVRVRKEDTDRYRRIIGVVRLEDGTNANCAIARAGLAWWYQEYAPKAPIIQRLETRARKSKTGQALPFEAMDPEARHSLISQPICDDS